MSYTTVSVRILWKLEKIKEGLSSLHNTMETWKWRVNI